MGCACTGIAVSKAPLVVLKSRNQVLWDSYDQEDPNCQKVIAKPKKLKFSTEESEEQLRSIKHSKGFWEIGKVKIHFRISAGKDSTHQAFSTAILQREKPPSRHLSRFTTLFDGVVFRAPFIFAKNPLDLQICAHLVHPQSAALNLSQERLRS